MISKDLVLKAINKDSDAITKIYQDTYKSAYALAFSITKNKEDAEDMLQEAYISAFKNIDKLKNQDGFDTWFNQIVANRCKNYLVKKKPTLFSSMGNEENDGFDISEAIEEQREEFQPEDTTETNEIKEIVSSMLDELPEDQKLCMIMFYGQDMKIKEISHALSISENTVKSRLMYGRKKMLELVKEKESKGYVLRSAISVSIFAIIPAILASKSIAVPSSGVILTELGVKAVASGVSSVATATATTAAKVGIPVITKVIIGIVGAGIIIGGGIFGISKLTESKVEPEQGSGIVSSENTDKALSNFESVKGFGEKQNMLFCWGAENWSTIVTINKDGTFTGYYHDSDMGKIYECNFKGNFNNIKKKDDYTYTMSLEKINFDNFSTFTDENGVNHISADPYGFNKEKPSPDSDKKFESASSFELYLPGKKVSSLAEGFIEWTRPKGDVLENFGMYNLDGEMGFIVLNNDTDNDDNIETESQSEIENHEKVHNQEENNNRDDMYKVIRTIDPITSNKYSFTSSKGVKWTVTLPDDYLDYVLIEERKDSCVFYYRKVKELSKYGNGVLFLIGLDSAKIYEDGYFDENGLGGHGERIIKETSANGEQYYIVSSKPLDLQNDVNGKPLDTDLFNQLRSERDEIENSLVVD